MRRIQAALDWHPVCHVNSNPMPKSELTRKKVSEPKVPFGEIVQKQRAAWLQKSDRLGDPSLAPCEVFLFPQIVVYFGRIFLPQIEGRIGKNQIHRPRLDRRHHCKTIPLIELAQSGAKNRLQRHNYRIATQIGPAIRKQADTNKIVEPPETGDELLVNTPTFKLGAKTSRKPEPF